MRWRKRYLLALVAVVVGGLSATPASAVGGPVLVAGGFDAPRGIAFFNGHLMVAEAGKGGPNCSVSPAPPNQGAFCFGRTGKISSVNIAAQTHSAFVDHLFSLLDYVAPPFPDVLGLGGLSSRDGKLMAIENVFPQLFADYTCPPADSACAADLAAARKEAGALLAVSRKGSFKVVANVGAHDYDYTASFVSQGQEHDANPYGVLAANGGTYVADAGSNTLDFVSGGGRIKILHHWTNLYPGMFPHDEVPTCVARADDSLWVATLTGHLYQVRGTSATQVAEPDLKHVTGCVSDGEDNIYFVNMWNNPSVPSFPTPASGSIVKFNAEEGSSSVVADNLNFPNMDTIGPDGNLYFTADSVCTTGLPPCPQGGTVWKLALAHGDDD